MKIKNFINKLMVSLLTCFLVLTNFGINVYAKDENQIRGGHFSFDKLDDSIASQELYVGSSEEDIKFPDKLTATLDDESKVEVAVTWNSNKEFDSSKVEDTFIYSPTITGEEYTVQENTELPTITVTIIEKVSTQDDSTDESVDAPVVITYSDGTTDTWDGTGNNPKKITQAATITVREDLTTAQYIEVGSGDYEVTIEGQLKEDGACPTITSNSSKNFVIVSGGSKTTIKNLKISSTHGAVEMYGDTEVENCNFSSSEGYDFYFKVPSNKTLTIKSGTYTVTGDDSSQVFADFGKGNKIIIESGTYSAKSQIATLNTTSSIEINGGTFKLTSPANNKPMFYYGNVDINGGTFNSGAKYTGMFAGVNSIEVDNCTIDGFLYGLYVMGTAKVGTGVTFGNYDGYDLYLLKDKTVDIDAGYNKYVNLYIADASNVTTTSKRYITSEYVDNSLLDNFRVYNDGLAVGYDGKYYLYRLTQYTVSFQFVSSNSTLTLPEEVTKLCPTGGTLYEGQSSELNNPSTTSVKVDGGTWNFVGWNPERITNITANTTVVGTWTYKADVYSSVTLDSEDGSATTTLRTLNGKLIDTLPTPTKENYIFKGWFTEETGGAQVNQDTNFTDISKIYAHWEMNKDFAESELAKVKTTAISKLDNKVEEAVKQINALDNLSDDEKEEYINQISKNTDNAYNTAKKNINDVTLDTTTATVDAALDTAKTAVNTAESNGETAVDAIVSNATLENDRNATLTNLDNYASTSKTTGGSYGGLSKDEKDALDAAIDAIVTKYQQPIKDATTKAALDEEYSKAKAEIDKVLEKYKATSNQALTTKKTNAANTLDSEANTAKGNIDKLGGLTDEQKTAYKNEVDEALKAAKESINSSTSLGGIDTIVQDTTDSINTSSTNAKTASDNGLANAKDNAKKKLQEEAQKAKDSVNNLGGLTTEEKTAYIKEIEDAITSTESAIDTSTSLSDIDSKIKSAEEGFNTTSSTAKTTSDNAIKKAKEDAIKSLEEEANKAKEEVDSLGGLTDEQKTSYKTEIDNKLKEAESVINDSNTLADIKSNKDKEASNISSISSTAETKSEEGLTNAKDKAKEEVEKSFEEASKKIDELDNLSDKQKEEYKNELEDKKNQALEDIKNETTLDSVNSTKEDASTSFEKETDKALIDDSKTEKSNLIDELKGLDNEAEKKQELLDKANKILEDASNALDKDDADASKIMEEADAKLDEVFKEAREEAHKHVTPGKVTVTTEYKNSAPNVTLEDSSSQSEVEDKLFTDKEKVEVDNGKNAKVWLEVTDVTDTIDSTDKKNITDEVESIKKSLSSNQTVSDSTYLDVSLFKQIEGEEKTPLTGTNKEVTITMVIPSSLVNANSNVSRTYRIIRSHSEANKTAVETIPTELGNSNTITFKTDKFSTYTLVYIDTKTVSTNNGGNNNSSSNNTSNNNSPCGENRIWSEKTKSCVYKVSNTSTK